MPDRTATDVKHSCINTSSDTQSVEYHLEVLRQNVRPIPSSTYVTQPLGLLVHDLGMRDEILNLERVVAQRSDPGGDLIAAAIRDLMDAGRVTAGPNQGRSDLGMVMITTSAGMAYCTVDEFGSISWSGFVDNVFSTADDRPHPAVYARSLGFSGDNRESAWGVHGYVGPDLDSVVVTTSIGPVTAVVGDGWWSALVLVEESEFLPESGRAGEAPFNLSVEARYSDGRVEALPVR